MEFNGVKVAILHEDRLLMVLRDNKPGLFQANMWDFPGGGREGDETPTECAIRETKEELHIELDAKSFVWNKAYPAQKDPNQKAYFLVTHLPDEMIDKIKLGNEGQKWEFVEQDYFFESENVIEALKKRFRDYLNSI